MGYASERRDRKRAKRNENLGLIAGLLTGLGRGLLDQKHHSDTLAIQQAKLLLQQQTEGAKLDVEKQKLGVSQDRAKTYEQSQSAKALTDFLKAKGSSGAPKATAAQMERAVNAIKASGAKTPEEYLKLADEQDRNASTQSAGKSLIERLLGSGDEAEAKKGRSAARYAIQSNPQALQGLFQQGLPNGAPPQDAEGQELTSLSDAYMTAIQGRPGDPAAMAAWGKIGQVFPQLVPAWVKAQAMGGFQVPPAQAQPQPDPQMRALEMLGRSQGQAASGR